jgi:hypothetical protein
VEVVVHESNKGHIATYNEGLLDWADGDYCVLMSADDRLTPGALQRARDLLDARPGVGFVHGLALWCWEGEPQPRPRTRLRGATVRPGREWLARRYRQGQNSITAPEVVVRTSLHKEVGGYDPRLPHSADLEMWLRLAAHAEVGFLRGVDQAFYRVHARNMRKGYDPVKDLQQKRLAFEFTLQKCADRLPEATRLADDMHRALSREALRTAADACDLGQAGEISVDDLIALALECWPAAEGSLALRTLQLRRRLGPQTLDRIRPVLQAPLAHRAQGWLQRRSWRYRGV